MKPLSLAALIAASLLPQGSSAKSTLSYGPIYASYKQPPGKGGGCISGSIGSSLPLKNQNVAIVFLSEENANGTLKQAAFGFAMDQRDDFSDGNYHASTFVMCLKPGAYRIVAFSALNAYNAQRVAIPFEVVAGKTIYLGSFTLHARNFDATTCQDQDRSHLFIRVQDEFARDQPVIQKNPIAAALPLEVRPVDTTLAAPYFVQCD